MLLMAACLSISGCVKRHFNQQSDLTESSSPTLNLKTSRPRININTASAIELETLPGIGKGLAGRIIEHRETFGPFRKPEHLIIVRGISDKRFRAVQDMITVE
jgi:competence ComEA-like helix-hairpin-helix protein